MSIDTTSKQNIWITGSSSGIGLALAKAYSLQGHTVFISGRNFQHLQDIAQGMMESQESELGSSSTVIPVACNVCSENDMLQAGRTINSHVSHLDKVILNAGDCEYFSLNKPDWSMMARMMDVNFLGSIRTLEVALPLLRNKPKTSSSNRKNRINNAHIIGISSLAIKAPFPRTEAYGSSKAAMQYFLNSLALDLSSEHIDVTTVLPGFVKTPLTERNDFNMPFLLDSQEAATRIINGVSKHPRTFTFPKRLSYMLKLSQWFPHLWQKMVTTKTADTQTTRIES